MPKNCCGSLGSNREEAMKMQNLSALSLAVAILAACSQSPSGVAQSRDDQAATAAQTHEEPQAGRGESGGDGGGGSY
jgi:starvation-inducible outer membrane lipoprotein